MKSIRFVLIVILAFLQGICSLSDSQTSNQSAAKPDSGKIKVWQIDLPDSLIVEAYKKASTQNVPAAVNPNVFPGYFSVCADGKGFYASLHHPCIISCGRKYASLHVTRH